MLYNETTQPLPIPNTIIKKNRFPNTDILATKFEYEQIGKNSFLELEPSVAKFAGFEIGKLNILKVKLVNTSPFPQRVHILPPSSTFFQIKCDKKGLLASGMHEEIFIYFKPNDYKYYFETLKIHTEDENLLLPIHAYPVIRRSNEKEIFPKMIDFGNVEIGDVQTFNYPISCKIPLNFQYEFNFLDEHPDIRVEPMKGIIPGKGNVDIEVSYTPSTNSTVSVTAELKISQFDFEPLKIRIMGSGKIKDRKISTATKLKTLGSVKEEKPLVGLEREGERPEEAELAEEQKENALNNSEKRKSTKATFRSKRSIVSMLGRKSEVRSQSESLTEAKRPGHRAKQASMTNRQLKEKDFLEKTNKVSSIDKEKEIKFFRCIGDKEISEDSVQEINTERDDYKFKDLKNAEYKGVHRYNFEADSDCPIIDQVVPVYDCKWDFLKNDDSKMRRLILKKFVQVATNFIVKSRCLLRLKKIKAFIGDAKTKHAIKKLVTEDWLKAEYAGVGKKQHIAFNFEFEEINMNKFMFPIQYESSNTFTNFKFDVNPRSTFDDWGPIAPIENCDAEIMGYKNIDMPPLVIHWGAESNRKMRTGAEEELFLRGAFGPFEPAQEKQILFSDMPKPLKKLIDIPFYRLISQHKTLRQFTQLSHVTEVDPEFKLQPSKFEFQDCIDPRSSDIEETELLRYEYLTKTPGLSSAHALNTIPLEMPYYYRRRLEIPFDYAFEQSLEKNCSKLMEGQHKEDIFSDTDSDGDGPPNVPVTELNDLLKSLEGDDKTIMEVRERNSKELFDEVSQIKLKINTAYHGTVEMDFLHALEIG